MTKDSAQNEINKSVNEDIKQLYRHADVANSEMGKIQIHMSGMEKDISYLKEGFRKIDSRTWWILGTLIVGILVEIFLTIKK